uniref:Uncharacterized protein n=1 Tax=Panagrolaimus sp. ES5 TaxID=591445 RepID=A0AC34FXQ8_9BILA
MSGFADYIFDSTVKSGQTWKQNDLLLTKSYKNLYGIDTEENGSKLQNQGDKECKKSTLSLHIAEYENAFEVQNVDGICIDKQTFGLPRQQQQTAALMKPEMMQFKASQKLMNPISRGEII